MAISPYMSEWERQRLSETMTPAEIEKEIRARKAKALRNRCCIMRGANLYDIESQLQEIQETASEWVYYYTEGGHNSEMVDAMVGDEDEASEFQNQFCMLSARTERLQEKLRDWFHSPDEYREFFDTFMAATSSGTDELLGYDIYEGDYYGLISDYDQEEGVEHAREKVKRMTKDKLLDAATWALEVYREYVAIERQYLILDAAMDALIGSNRSMNEQVQAINELYDKATEKLMPGSDFDTWGAVSGKFDKLVSCMPASAWVQ